LQAPRREMRKSVPPRRRGRVRRSAAEKCRHAAPASSSPRTAATRIFRTLSPSPRNARLCRHAFSYAARVADGYRETGSARPRVLRHAQAVSPEGVVSSSIYLPRTGCRRRRGHATKRAVASRVKDVTSFPSGAQQRRAGKMQQRQRSARTEAPSIPRAGSCPRKTFAARAPPQRSRAFDPALPGCRPPREELPSVRPPSSPSMPKAEEYQCAEPQMPTGSFVALHALPSAVSIRE